MLPLLASTRAFARSSAPVEASPTDDDGELVLRARAGDRTAGAQIFRRHARTIANVAARLTGSRADADDIVQDTFVTALEQLDELRDPDALRAWLTRIAVNRAQKRLRRRRLLRWLGLDRGDDDASLDQLAARDASPDARAELARIARVLDRCDADERVAWMLHRVEGETLEASAAACGCSLATVKRRIAAVEHTLDRALDTRESPR